MNRVILMGRLTKDPEMRYSNAAEPLAIVRYTLAVNRPISRDKKSAGEQDVDFINCTAFGRQAEFVEKYFRKGQMVAVEGRMQVRSYDDNTGQKRWATEVITDNHHFAESRASFESRSQGNDYNNFNNYDNRPSQVQPASRAPVPQPPATDGFFEVDNSLSDDDLPF